MQSCDYVSVYTSPTLFTFAGHGHYLYMDSPGYALGTTATLVSPPIAYPSGGYCVQFAYNMYGVDVSTLR